MALKTYRDLEVWQRAMDLTEAAYRFGTLFPKDERFGLLSQLQRSAVSVPANIAEGYGRTHRGDYLHHLSIARGSLAELETHIALAVRLGYATREDALAPWNFSQDVGRMLNKLLKSLEKAPRNPEPGSRTPKRLGSN